MLRQQLSKRFGQHNFATAPDSATRILGPYVQDLPAAARGQTKAGKKAESRGLARSVKSLPSSLFYHQSCARRLPKKLTTTWRRHPMRSAAMMWVGSIRHASVEGTGRDLFDRGVPCNHRQSSEPFTHFPPPEECYLAPLVPSQASAATTSMAPRGQAENCPGNLRARRLLLSFSAL